MYFQEFQRVKAQFNNNISACYCVLGEYTEADIYNNAAIMEDPDYGEALFRKCEIYEDMCEYTMCLNMAEWLMQKL